MVPGLRDVPCAFLPREAPSIYRLRAEAHETGLATIEAIARAMVERTLWSRGELSAAEVTGGVPHGAMCHDPRSGLASD